MPVKPDLSIPVPEKLGKVHFIGIGGSGMSGIAHMMLDAGLEVSGSDREGGVAVSALQRRGVRVHVGHAAQNLQDADSVVFTSAIWPDNPEYTLAQERGLTMLHRSQALHWLSRGKRVVAVAGAHGKTTTTAMIVTILRECGLDPSFVNGGTIRQLGVSAATGTGDIFVLEADESDGSFLLYNTALAVVTNVDPVHLDHFGTAEGYFGAFADFAAGANEAVVAGFGDELDEILSGINPDRITRFGEDPAAGLRVTVRNASDSVEFDLNWNGLERRATLQGPGRHNAVNAAAAVSAAVKLGVEFAQAVAAVESFAGTKRRFESHGQVRGIAIFDDYAHEPAEVAATLAAARSVVGSGRVIAVYQPHLYSRTQRFAEEFARAYEDGADHTVIVALDPAREDEVPGVSGALVAERFHDQSRVSLIEDWGRAADQIALIAEPGDLVITLSCGTIYRMVPTILAALQGAQSPLVPGHAT